MEGHCADLLRRSRLGIAAGLLVVGGALMLPAGASAATAPAITGGPEITGAPQVGAQLIANATWTGDPAPTASWTWFRCARATGPCSVIAGATSDRYRVPAADEGWVLRARVTVSNSAGSDESRSKATAEVAAAPPPGPSPTPAPTASPAPPPTATPVPLPTPTPGASPVPSPTATPASPLTPTPPAAFDFSVATVAPPVAANPVEPPAVSVPRMLKPFPVVRIKGLLTPRGARVTLLSVRAPRGARIAVACTGSDCPVRRFTTAAGVRRLRRFERDLRAGTRLEVSITKRGYIGKRTVITIRRGLAPRRSDRCLAPETQRVMPCAPA